MSNDETLPVPPLRLRRVWLQGVGPDGARFDPLDLNFNTPLGAASRVLLSLTNTGGKSTLITLLSSLVVPAARSQVGSKNLGDYVLTGDTAHIVCEWEDSATDVRTITGSVMEWKDGRRQPSSHKQRSTTNMNRAWYLFRTGATPPGADQLPFTDGDTGATLPGIDQMPFIDDEGRRSTLTGFMSAMRELKERHPAMRWVETSVQQEWTKALLEHTSIDPVLFEYQMRMNDDEAGAKALLEPFSSNDNAIRFFIEALNDDREFADLTTRLGTYAELAADRPNLLLLNSFCTEIEPKIATIAKRAGEVREAELAALNDRISCAEFAGSAKSRLESDQKLLDQQTAEVAAAEQRAIIAKREYDRISDIRAQLALENARYELAQAAQDMDKREQEADAADGEKSAWDAVQPVKDFKVAQAQREVRQRAYDEADAGLSPLRDRTDAAAAALAGRLTGLIGEHERAAKDADDRCENAEKLAKEATAESKRAAERAADARHRLDEIDKAVRASAAASEAARKSGWLNAGETAEHCVRRWQTHRAEAARVEKEQQQLAAEADLARTAAERAKDERDGEMQSLQRVSLAHQGALENFDRDLAKIASGPGIARLLEDSPLTGAEIARAKGLADSGAYAADRRAAAHETAAAAAQEELSYFDETGTAPAGPDILAVAAALSECRIGAVTGLQWLENNIVDPDQRRDYIETNPDIAGGVIVTDPSKLSVAEEKLSARGLRTRTPVAVVANPAHSKNTAATNGTAGRFVIIPHRATWDRQWAQDARAEYETAVAQEGAAAVEAREDAALHRDTAHACAEFLDRWGGVNREQLQGAASESAAALAATAVKRTELGAERDRQRDAGQQARAKAEEAAKDFRRADRNVTEADNLLTKVKGGELAAQRRALVEAEKNRAGEAEVSADRAAEHQGHLARRATNEAAQARSNITSAGQELENLGVEVPGPDPGGSLDVIRAEYTASRQQLSEAERGMVEAELLDQAKVAVSAALERTKRFDPPILARAEVLADLPEASTQHSLHAAQRRAEDTARDCRGAFIEARHRKGVAEEELRKAQPASDRQNHADLTNFPEWNPATPEAIPSLMEQLEERNITLRELAKGAEQDVAEAEELRKELETDVEAFEGIVDLWVGDPAPDQPPLSGTKRDASRAMRNLLEQQQKSDSREREAKTALSNAINAARYESQLPRWESLNKHLVLRLRRLTDHEFTAEAEPLAETVRTFAVSTSGDLEKMDTHRNLLRDSLFDLCRQQRRLLREVGNSSRLPAGLGELSDQPAIKIRFEDLSEDESRGRLGDRVDKWAIEIGENPKRAASSQARTRWLAEAVRDTVRDRPQAGAWSIEILKPRIDGQLMYCPPERVDQEFSGGQVLTLAVLVYCALSKVRASHRTGGAKPAGTLLLDNPFGAASAETLIQMQHQLAAYSGIQLVCATGLNEPNVERAFHGEGSVIVKLRNDGDQRRNQSFLRIRERIVDGVEIAKAITGGKPVDSQQNWVQGTRYEIRQ